MIERTEKNMIPKKSLQQIVDAVERQSAGINFDSLCTLVSETVLCRNARYGGNTVRWQILENEISTKCVQPTPMSIHQLLQRTQTRVKRPFCISYGLGVDSTAVLIWLARQYLLGKSECRPDLITFADVGNEKKETYAYLPIIQAYLKRVGFPEVTVVRYQPNEDRVKYGMYYTLEQDCLVKDMLPSWAYHKHGCSAKWKLAPQDKCREENKLCQQAWNAGYRAIVAIGYDASPKDAKRRWKVKDDERYEYIYPLMDLGWDRERCIEEIRAEGLPGWETDQGGLWLPTGGVPVKSACWFCPSTQPHELVNFSKTDHGREYLRAIIRMEANAEGNLQKIEGLWGNGSKGTRGGEVKPGKMTTFIMENNLLGDNPNLLPIVDQFNFGCSEQCAGCF